MLTPLVMDVSGSVKLRKEAMRFGLEMRMRKSLKDEKKDKLLKAR